MDPPDDVDRHPLFMGGCSRQRSIESSRILYSSVVLYIAAAQIESRRPRTCVQTMIAEAMRSIDKLLEAIGKHPEIDNPNYRVFGGLLTRTTLLRMREIFHGTMGNYKKFMQDLNKALKIDENYTAAREVRIHAWAAKALKDGATILAEYTRILHEVHEDDERNDESYAWLALIIMKNPTLGTMDDANLYYEKSHRSSLQACALPSCMADVRKQMSLKSCNLWNEITLRVKTH